MSFDLDHNPAYKALGHAADIACLAFVLIGIYGLFFAQRQIRRGEERPGRQSRKQSVIFIIIGIGYFLVSHIPVS
ncbi:MAG: hypothetical protein WCD79_10520 [Chthoniobacteraceae bacterium]